MRLKFKLLFIAILIALALAGVFSLKTAAYDPVTVYYLPVIQTDGLTTISVTAYDGFKNPLSYAYVYAIDTVLLDTGGYVYAFDTRYLSACYTDYAGSCQIKVRRDMFRDGRDGWLFLTSPNLELWMDVKAAPHFLVDDGSTRHNVYINFNAAVPATPVRADNSVYKGTSQ